MKFKINEKVYASVRGAIREAVVLAGWVEKAAFGGMKTLYEVSILNGDGTRTVATLEDMAVFHEPHWADCASIIKMNRKRLPYLAMAYDAILHPLEEAAKLSRDKKGLVDEKKIKKILDGSQVRRNRLEGAIEQDFKKAEAHCKLFGIDIPADILALKKQYEEMKNAFLAAVGKSEPARAESVRAEAAETVETKETAETVNTRGAALQLVPMVLPVTKTAESDTAGDLPVPEVIPMPGIVMPAARAAG